MLEINKIHNADCLEAMKKIPDASIDLILCDLPYGTSNCGWDIVIPFKKLWKEYQRIRKDNSAIVLFGQEPFSSFLRLSNLQEYKYDWYWEKEKPTNIFQVKRRPGKVIETISVFYKKQCTFNPQMRKHVGPLVKNSPKGSHSEIYAGKTTFITPYNDTGFRYPSQLIKIRREKNGIADHPTQKPVALFEYLIKTYTNENDLVLDSCAGSATTAIACENLKRNWICIEKNKEYCETGEKRLAANNIVHF